jgi:uncharacterized protein YfiM (DUF2279 family)
VRLGERHVCVELEVQRHARAAGVLVDRDVVDVADQWLGERGAEHAVAQVEIMAAGFEVHHHIAAWQRRPYGRLDPVGHAVARDSRLAGRDRHDGIGEVAAA